MTRAVSRGDPRSIVTPDAFEVSKSLLGLKLAAPRRRLGAMLADLTVIAIITALTRSFAVVLGVLAATLFIRASFKHSPVGSAGSSRAKRGSLGCLGLLIGVVTAIVWASVGPGGGLEDDGEPTRSALQLSTDGGGVVGALATAVMERAFREATTLEQAEAAAYELAAAGRQLGMEPESLRDLLTAAVPDSAPWADDAPAMFDRVLPRAASEAVELRDVSAVRDEVSLYSTEEALSAYAELLASGREEDMDLVRRDALRVRLGRELAADTLRALEGRVERLEGEVDDVESDLREVRERADRLESRGVFGRFRSFLDDLGFGFGWAALYFTATLAGWRGQTLGKRLFRIRVLRLDGHPITWWVAFERAGGYAAGLATGLLGFAQVYWDPNRQAIHDRIVGTIVVVDPPTKVLNWETQP